MRTAGADGFSACFSFGTAARRRAMTRSSALSRSSPASAANGFGVAAAGAGAGASASGLPGSVSSATRMVRHACAPARFASGVAPSARAAPIVSMSSRIGLSSKKSDLDEFLRHEVALDVLRPGHGRPHEHEPRGIDALDLADPLEQVTARLPPIELAASALPADLAPREVEGPALQNDQGRAC